MAKRPPDAKTHALKQHGCLNPCAEAVRDELFLSNAFFDPRDLVQVKYEMLRRVREDGVPVSRAAASFGVSRPTWYQAQRAYEAGGLPALLPHRPGPRRPHKLSDEVVEALRVAMSCQYRSKTPQKCRSKSPRSGLAPASPLEGWLGRSNTRRLRWRRAAKGRGRVVKIEELFMIHQLREQGESITAIAKRAGLDRKTVRKYLKRGVEPATYGPRAPRPRVIDPYRAYLRERLERYRKLSAMRLLREIRALGYRGGRTAVTDYVAEVRPREASGFEHRFETPAGHQAQVDFAQFKVVFTEEADRVQVVWLFSMVLGYSRYVFARFVRRQDLHTVVRSHLEAFAEFGGTPREVLYDRMKTAVLGEDDDGRVRYHPTLLDVAGHFGFRPRACAAYRAKTKGKVERVFRYVREDFFLGTEFADLHDLNTQLGHWRATVANQRVHGTTGRRVDEAFAQEREALQAMPVHPYTTVLRVERRLSRDGMVSVEGNQYSVPDSTRRTVEPVNDFETPSIMTRRTPAHLRWRRTRRRTSGAPRPWRAPGRRQAPPLAAARRLSAEPVQAPRARAARATRTASRSTPSGRVRGPR